MGPHAFKTKFGKLLHKRRLTSEEFAALAGFSVSAVRLWRQGIRNPSKGSRVLIARALGIAESKINDEMFERF